MVWWGSSRGASPASRNKPAHAGPAVLRHPARAGLTLVCALLATLSSRPEALAKPQQAPNSRVVLDLPQGYRPAELFAGFQNDTYGVSFVVMEAPLKAYEEMAAGFTPAALGTRGIVDVRPGTLARQDTHVYLRGRQASAAGTYAKYFVLIKGADVTVLVSANVPQTAVDAGAVKPEEIEKILASASLADQLAVREIYALDYLGPFKSAGTIVGTSRLYTLDGRMEPERKGELRSTFIVAPSFDKMAVPDTPDFARRLLMTLAGFKEVETGEVRAVTIAGLEGSEIEGRGLDDQSGAPITLYQVVLRGRQGGYFRMIGIAKADEAARLVPEFRRMARSFRPIE